ncbi:peptidylprolyl isomerase [Novosphingobium fuchskuhlense]|uniref:Peptidyl-prolyl cis-trans isomerase n=1 Tax=Novosphingobium fuchskuhlense TaxID=1117702 RepID=A0A117UVY2_9SPHN|nr:peptidylprolyl isomerase [Novosphingobium fuchskuhlense]KUR71818.1 peptidylprolyl isomerase [Novosphingobium fuchskuhlense]
MASRVFNKVMLALALGAAFVAPVSPAQAQRPPEKEAVKPIKVDPIQHAQTMTYAVDADIAHDPDNVLLLDLSNGGRVAIRLMPEWAPHHVERIKTLTKQGFYNGVIFHRVIEGFMAQTGDPTGTGQGGSTLPNLDAEFNDIPHLRGTVSMARTDEPNTANSQFFIVFYPRFALDHKYTNFGRVIAGMDTVDAIVRGEPPKNPTKIVQASLASEGKAPPPPPAPAAPATFTADMLSNSKSN